jgi:hypothetical protein
MIPMRILPCIALVLVACQARAVEEPPIEPAGVAEGDPVLRTYAVPAGRSEEVARVLRHALSQGADTPPRGTVNPLDDGRLVVLAPASVHEGISGLCEDLEDVGAAPGKPTIAISYWLVLADPTGSGVAETIPKQLAPALEEITQQDGSAAFSLLESTRIASLANASGEAQGRYARIEQLAIVGEDGIVADLDIEADLGSKLKTRLSLTPGELVVLGHAGRQLPDRSEARLYYIVRAEAG